MSKLHKLLPAAVAFLFFGLAATSMQASGNPMADCLQCGEALLLCAEGVQSEYEACVESCGGDTTCLDGCAENAQAGIAACKATYEACVDSACSVPGSNR